MTSFNSPSQSCEVDCESTHNDPLGSACPRKAIMIKPILLILILIQNCLDIAWLDVQHHTQQVSAVLRIQQFFAAHFPSAHRERQGQR